MSSIGHRMMKLLAARWLPWSLMGAILLFALLHEIVGQGWLDRLSRSGQVAIWSLALLGLVLLYLVISRMVTLYEQREQLKQRLAQAERREAESYQRLEAIFEISQQFADASDENQVIQPMLRLVVELSGAVGASFVPLDEHGQPQTALSHGEIPFPVMEAWLEYLATPSVRERCRNCGRTTPALTGSETMDILDKPASCPLLKGPIAEDLNAAAGLLCLPVRRAEREFGVVNLFLPETTNGHTVLDKRTSAYLRTLLDETALGLEGIRLRRNELAALRQMQSLRQKTDLKALLNSLLENVHRTLEADFAMMAVLHSGTSQGSTRLVLGDFPTDVFSPPDVLSPQQTHPFLDSVLQGVIASGEPILLGDVAGDPALHAGLRSLVAVPLISSGGTEGMSTVLGAMLLGNRRARSFSQRQLDLLQTVAGQVALVVQNTHLMAELEYQTLIQERIRLAREIHDGLAQTLGFLKLQSAQMLNYFSRDEIDRVRQSVEMCHATLSEAYQDARQAIDGLRVSPCEFDLAGWLEQTVNDFQEVTGDTGLLVEIEALDVHTDLPPEVHAQLIRIVQEALSNVRKHARANQVRIACREIEQDLVLEVRDNGEGFAPEDIPVPSRHGLRGMRERAELIGADFQVVSQPEQGTVVRVRLPLRMELSPPKSTNALGEVIS